MKRKTGRISPIRETTLLIYQYWLILTGNMKDLMVTMIFPLAAMLITIWIAGKNMFVTYEGTRAGCFVLVSAAIWGGMFNSIQTIVKERSIIKRDIVTGGMRIWCFTISRAFLQMVLCAFQTFILCIAFPALEKIYENSLPESGLIFESALLECYLSLFLLMFAADAMGLAISCFVKKAETASVLAPYILIVQLILSGILFSLEGFGKTVSAFMISRWGTEALGSVANCNSLPLSMINEKPELENLIEQTADDMFLYEPEHLRKVWLILLAFSIVFIFFGDLLLHKVKKDSRE